MKASNRIQAMAAAAMLGLAGMAAAAQPSYSHIEGGVGFHDISAFDDYDEEGLWAGFSAQLGDALYVNGKVQRYSGDRLRRDFVDDRPAFLSDGSENLDFVDANLGYRLPIGSRTDLNIELGADYRGDRGEDEYDYRASFGVRSRLLGNFEGRAMVGYRDDESFGSGDYLLTLEGSYYFSSLLAATVQFETDEFDTSLARAGVRLTF